MAFRYILHVGSSSFVVTASGSAFAVTGASVGLDHVREIGAGAGSFAMTGAAVSLVYSGLDPLFEDDFETGNLQSTSAGSGWLWARSGEESFPDPDLDPDGMYFGVYNDGAVIAGNYSFIMQYPEYATQPEPNLEQYFWYDGVPRLWLEWYMTAPANYIHKSGGAGGGQNKFMTLYGGVYAYDADQRPFVLYETWRNSDTSSSLRVRLGNTYIGGTEPGRIDEYIDPFISPAGLLIPGGAAVRFRTFVDRGTEELTGIVKVWVGDTLYVNETGCDLWGSTAYPDFDRGYLLGYSNSGFTDLTRFHFDNWKFYTSDPGW